MSSFVDRFVRPMRSDFVSLEHAPHAAHPPPCYDAHLRSVFDINRSTAELVVPHQNRIKAQAFCDGWNGWPSQDVARRGAVPLFNYRCD